MDGDVGEEGKGVSGGLDEIFFEADLILERERCARRGEEGVLVEIVLPALGVQVLLSLQGLLDTLTLDVALPDLVNAMQHLFHSLLIITSPISTRRLTGGSAGVGDELFKQGF